MSRPRSTFYGSFNVAYTNAHNRPFAANHRCRCSRCQERFEMVDGDWRATRIVVVDENIDLTRPGTGVMFFHPDCFRDVKTEFEETGKFPGRAAENGAKPSQTRREIGSR